MLEILFFAILSGYLFFRLWSVLGERTGFEKPFEEGDRSMVDVTPSKYSKNREKNHDMDNVISLPSRGRDDTMKDGLEQKHVYTVPQLRFREEEARIQALDKNFEWADFMEKASMAFEIITQAFAEADRKTLKTLLTTKVFGQFEKILSQRDQRGESVSNEIVGPIFSKIDAVQVEGKKVSVTMIITSDQRYITYDAQGKILDNPEKITLKIISAWTFERDYQNKDLTWYLSQTRAME